MNVFKGEGIYSNKQTNKTKSLGTLLWELGQFADSRYEVETQ